MEAACERALALGQEAPKEWVADKGYHCNETMELMEELELRGYISEPDRGTRRWKGKETARRGTYANRRRIRGERGKRLMRQRVGRSSSAASHMSSRRAACDERGYAATRTSSSATLVHVAGFNLGIVMRRLLGAGTPRGLAALPARLHAPSFGAITGRDRRPLRIGRAAQPGIAAANMGCSHRLSAHHSLQPLLQRAARPHPSPRRGGIAVSRLQLGTSLRRRVASTRLRREVPI